MYDEKYFGYDFVNNMGYGIKKYLFGLDIIGICFIYCISFVFVKEVKLYFDSLK